VKVSMIQLVSVHMEREQYENYWDRTIEYLKHLVVVTDLLASGGIFVVRMFHGNLVEHGHE